MILDRILEHKKAELRRKESRGYLTSLKGQIADRPNPLGFIKALETACTPDSPALIAEVKKASPSQGLMRPEFRDKFDPVEIAQTYKEHGAASVSVLTDQEFFQGSLNYLSQVKDHVGLPTLNKEFVVDDIQFYEARAYGADAVLLIVAALDRIARLHVLAVHHLLVGEHGSESRAPVHRDLGDVGHAPVVDHLAALKLIELSPGLVFGVCFLIGGCDSSGFQLPGELVNGPGPVLLMVIPGVEDLQEDPCLLYTSDAADE